MEAEMHVRNCAVKTLKEVLMIHALLDIVRVCPGTSAVKAYRGHGGGYQRIVNNATNK
jgi:hypothetical protein